MKAQSAVYIFLIICFVLAILLLTHTITPIISGSIFALCLLVLGGISRGFRKS